MINYRHPDEGHGPFKPFPLTELPDDIIARVLGGLGARDLCSLISACRVWREVCEAVGFYLCNVALWPRAGLVRILSVEGIFLDPVAQRCTT